MLDKLLAAIPDKELIPWRYVVVLLGLTIWGVRLDQRAQASDKALTALQQKQDEYNRTVQRIDDRLSRIEGRLDVIHKPDDGN